jgi:hypothetical protein
MAGWQSRYDSPKQNNTDKYFGRKLHLQDNYWAAAKIVGSVLAIYLGYLFFNGFFDLHEGTKTLFKYLIR